MRQIDWNKPLAYPMCDMLQATYRIFDREMIIRRLIQKGVPEPSDELVDTLLEYNLAEKKARDVMRPLIHSMRE